MFLETLAFLFAFQLACTPYSIYQWLCYICESLIIFQGLYTIELQCIKWEYLEDLQDHPNATERGQNRRVLLRNSNWQVRCLVWCPDEWGLLHGDSKVLLRLDRIWIFCVFLLEYLTLSKCTDQYPYVKILSRYLDYFLL
jgi:hypothetical protein